MPLCMSDPKTGHYARGIFYYEKPKLFAQGMSCYRCVVGGVLGGELKEGLRGDVLSWLAEVNEFTHQNFFLPFTTICSILIGK